MKQTFGPISEILKSAKEGIVDKGIAKLDIVSREEFEVQKKILLKTRHKLEQVEEKLDQLLADKSK